MAARPVEQRVDDQASPLVGDAVERLARLAVLVEHVRLDGHLPVLSVLWALESAYLKIGAYLRSVAGMTWPTDPPVRRDGRRHARQRVRPRRRRRAPSSSTPRCWSPDGARPARARRRARQAAARRRRHARPPRPLRRPGRADARARRPGLRDRRRHRRDPSRRRGQGADPAPDVRRRLAGRAPVPGHARGRRRDDRARRRRADGDRPRPGESPHDSVWTLDGDGRTVFSADVAYDRKHGYLADGFHAEWLANIARLRARAAGRHDAAPRPRRAVRPRGPRLAGGLHHDRARRGARGRLGAAGRGAHDCDGAHPRLPAGAGAAVPRRASLEPLAAQSAA